MATIYSLFPTPVIVRHADVLDEEVTYVTSLATCDNIGNHTSIDRNVLDACAMERLRNGVTKALHDYVSEVYKPKYPMDMYITQSWANYTYGNEYHHLHNHKNSIVSGVLYLAAGRNYDSIQFYNPNEADIVMATDEESPFNNAGYRIVVGKGDLVLFPSRLWHSVERLAENRRDARISIAFNSFARGIFGDDISLTELKL